MRPVSDWIVDITPEGVVSPLEPVATVGSAGTDSEAASTIIDADSTDDSDPQSSTEKGALGKLMVAEEKARGKVSRRTILRYFTSAGGVFFWILYFAIIVFGEVLFAYCNYWLGIWSRAYEGTDPSKVSILFYLGVYVILMLLQVCSYNASTLLWTFGCLRASRDLHQRLTTAVLGSTLRWLDTTPTGNMISRFTKDIKSCDSTFPRVFQGVSELTVTLALKFILLIYMVPAFAPLALAVGVVGGIFGEFYVRCQIDVKRESSNAKSPLYSQFAAAISGVISIRAFSAETKVQRQLQVRADHYTQCATSMYNLNRWINIRVDVLGAIFSSGLAYYLLSGSTKYDSILIGFGLNQAVSVSEIILHWVKVSNEFEVQCNSIERINEFLTIDSEPASTKKNQPPASWPTSGEIVFDKVSARYFDKGPLVLKDISLRVESGSRVGIIGRTGSGSSRKTV
jgi:ABC-type multidrug transport system fused ATPase/permease subunit